jgi:acetyl-CoA carboxylase biotin carboxyl carrier protein
MIDVSKIEKLMALMSQHGFDVVQAENGGERISLARHTAHAALFQNSSAASADRSGAPRNPPAPQEVLNQTPESQFAQKNALHVTSNVMAAEVPPQQPQGTTITSPFVGTFYRSPGPEVAPFVELGSYIKKGQSLCIVEAMKLMNEIESEVEGEIVAILVENAKPVEFGTPLFIVAPA